MTLPIDKRYKIVFFSQYPMGEKAVVKAVKSVKSTVQYWLDRWKQSKDLSDIKRPGRPRATTEKVDQRIYKLAGNNNIATTGDIKISELVKRQFDKN